MDKIGWPKQVIYRQNFLTRRREDAGKSRTI
jgi:hypothetical protein